MEYTHELCLIVDKIKKESIGSKVMTDVRYRLLDWLGCVLGAIRLPSAQAVLKQAEQTRAIHGASTAIGLSERVSADSAAFVNGILSHALEYDDTNKIAITHPGGVVIAAAAAAAEQENSTFEEFSAAVAAGYEVMIRLGGAMNPRHYEYWHTTGTCGAFAAACAAGKLMGLNVTQMQTAVGLAATMASGLVSVFGTDAKLVNVGNAASRGIVAAQLSRAGFTAPVDVIEREKGYAAAANGEEDLSFLTRSSKFLMIEDAYYKIHASCGHTHCALDALMTIMQNTKFTDKDINKIRIGVYRKAAELTGALDTSSESKARFSMPYCIAACIVLGQVGLDAFTKDSLNDMRILELAKKVSVVNDKECDIGYPACRTETVRIELNNGSILTGKMDLPNGHPPAEFLENKYMSLAVRSIRMDQADRIKDFILNCKEEHKFKNLGNLIRSEVYYG